MNHAVQDEELDELRRRLTPRQIIQRQNFVEAWDDLQHRVVANVRVRQGEEAIVQAGRAEVLQFVGRLNAEAYRGLFSGPERRMFCLAVDFLLGDLDYAAEMAADPPQTVAPIPVVTLRTGQRGRPKKIIPSNFLAAAYALQGPAKIAQELGNISSRSVRRRLVEEGLAVPQPPVFEFFQTEQGPARLHTTSTRPVSTMSDDELDLAMEEALTTFPEFGRSLLAGYFRGHGQNVPRDRLRAAYDRLHGPGAAYAVQPVERREYSVKGPMSMAHVDGQHGLIRYHMVIHCIVDGYSRYVLGIRVHDNNRADSVLRLFVDACSRHGFPSRARGDHGVENLGMAAVMENVRGPGRGSFIWGPSVHNQRIERLWFDVTRGFGRKWKAFFRSLEQLEGLNPDNECHIWLLHTLFLRQVNRDALEWAESWNNHKMQLPQRPQATPKEMMFFGTVEEGMRAVSLQDVIVDLEREQIELAVVHEPPEQMEGEGHGGWVDGQAGGSQEVVRPPEDVPVVRQEVEPPRDPMDGDLFEGDEDAVPDIPEPGEHQGTDGAPNNGNSFNYNTRPTRFTEVICNAPGCPFSPDEVGWLFEQLQQRVNILSSNMTHRRWIWHTALQLCEEIWERRGRQ